MGERSENRIARKALLFRARSVSSGEIECRRRRERIILSCLSLCLST